MNLDEMMHIADVSDINILACTFKILMILDPLPPPISV